VPCRGGGKSKAARIEATARPTWRILCELEVKVFTGLEQLRALLSSPMLLIGLSELAGYHDLMIQHIILIGDRLLEGRTIP
jgi:hypothetical protein